MGTKVARTTMYHVAKASEREDILQNGLRAEGPIYLWGHPQMAAKYVGYKSMDYDPIDVWQVDASGLPLERDPFFFEDGEPRTWGYGNPGTGKPDAWRYRGAISPDRLTLIEQDLTRIERKFNEFPRGWTTQMNPRTEDFYERMKEFPWQTQSNILDPIQAELDQKVFRGTDLREFHRLFIMRLYQRALRQEFGVTGEGWADLYLTGSLTTYQYSETSDADTSVFANWERFYNELGIDSNEARKRLIALSIEHIDGTFLPGTTHPLQFFVVPAGTLPSDLYKPGLRSAYSLDDDMWFQEPERDRVHDIATEMPDVFERAVEMADKMREMLDHDPEQARQLWHDIHKKRQLDQRAGLGDFCEGNVVYKYLLNQGLFDRIQAELGEYIATTKTSAATMYHATLPGRVESIMQHGLLQKYSGEDIENFDWESGQGLYFFESAENAYKIGTMKFGSTVVLAVDMTDIPIQLDPDFIPLTPENDPLGGYPNVSPAFEIRQQWKDDLIQKWRDTTGLPRAWRTFADISPDRISVVNSKTAEFDFENISVRKTVTISRPWDDDDPEDYENYVRDEYDVEDEEDPIEAAAQVLWDQGLTEPSSGPGFNSGIWYSNPDGGWESAKLYGFTEQEEREIWAILKADNLRNKAPDAPPLGHPLDWTAKVGARPENYDPWANGGQPPFALEDVGPGGLQEHINELAAKNNVEIRYDAGQPNQFGHEEEWSQYQGRPDNPYLPDMIHIFPIEDDPYRYFAALHELAHIEFRRQFKQPQLINSTEEESWCWAWAVEHSEVALPPEVLYQAHGYWEGYDTSWNIPTYAPYKADWYRWPMDFDRYTGAAWGEGEGWKPEMPQEIEDRFVQVMECPWDGSHLKQSEQGVYCPYCGWQPSVKEAFIDPEDAYFYEEEGEENPVRRHEYWRTFWIDPQEIYDNGERVHVMLNSDEVDVGDPVTVKWESGQGRMMADGVVEYIVDPELADEAFSQNRPVSDWASVIRIDLDSMQPIVYAKRGAFADIQPLLSKWWWQKQPLDEGYEAARPYLQQADKYLAANWQNMTSSQFSRWSWDTVFNPIIQAWQQLPEQLEPEYPNIKPWAELDPMNQRLRSEEEHEAVRLQMRDRNEFYRTMDPGDMQDRTDMFWEWSDYWRRKIVQNAARTQNPDSGVIIEQIGNIRKSLEQWNFMSADEQASALESYISTELRDWESWSWGSGGGSNDWEERYLNKVEVMGKERYSIMSGLLNASSNLRHGLWQFAPWLDVMSRIGYPEWGQSFDFETFEEKIDLDVALENVPGEDAEGLKKKWQEAEENFEHIKANLAYLESYSLRLRDLEGQEEVPDTFPSDWLAHIGRWTAATDHLWDERVTTKVVYDFDTDRLFLGTMADIPNLPSNKVIGEYADDVVEIFETEKQWVSPTYFKRLWHHSFPNKPLDGVYFRQADGEKFRLDRMRKREQDG